MKIPKITRLVLITDVVLAATFSGCDVWLIPLIDKGYVYNDNGDKSIAYKLDFDNAFLGDDWYIQNEHIYGYDKGPFAIGIPLKRFNARFCQTKEFEKY